MITGYADRMCWHWLALAMLIILPGCGGGYAPVHEPAVTAGADRAPGPAPIPDSGVYVVRRGDTLYSIAWRYGLDYRDVARWNGIGAPYTIYPGDRIRLQAPARAAAAPAVSVAQKPDLPPAPVPSPPLPRSSADRQSPARAAASPPLRTRPLSPPLDPAARRTDPPVPVPATRQETRVAVAESPAADAPAPLESLPSGPIRWQWPTQGTLIHMQSPTAEKGIKLGGHVGQPIHAAAPGRVVYSGSGLIGYGKLIIIKHNDTYLSAYAHNSELLVKEGDSVSGGQQIATMGTGADGRAALHFEIRRNGQPIDPLQHLPQRQG